MPISSQVPIIGYVANGVTKSFAFPFAILSADDLKVKAGADVVTTGFSIAGVGDRDGGSVTFTDAPASLTPIILYREVTLDRTTDYQENGDLLAIVLDDDLDRIWMALQDQLLLSDRALRSPLGETLQQLPPASERALMALAFDAAGNPIVVRGTNDGGSALALDLMDTAPGKGAALVGYDGGTAQDVLDDAKPMANYAALRAYTGRATGVRITQAGLAGIFQRDAGDTTSADNGGTIIVDASGRRWKRIYSGLPDIRWFGAILGQDNTAAIQATLNAGAMWIPDGEWELSTATVTRPGTIIEGESKNAILKRKALTYKPLIVADGKNDVIATRFKVDGNKAGSPLTGSWTPSGGGADIALNEQGDIALRNGNNGLIEGVDFVNSLTSPALMYNMTASNILGCNSYGHQREGFYIISGRGNRIARCDSRGDAAQPWSLIATAGLETDTAPHDHIVENNYCYDSQAAFVTINTTYTKVRHNVIGKLQGLASTGPGIRLGHDLPGQSAEFADVHNNRVFGITDSGSGGTGRGISIENAPGSDVHQNIVNGCRVGVGSSLTNNTGASTRDNIAESCTAVGFDIYYSMNPRVLRNVAKSCPTGFNLSCQGMYAADNYAIGSATWGFSVVGTSGLDSDNTFENNRTDSTTENKWNVQSPGGQTFINNEYGANVQALPTISGSVPDVAAGNAFVVANASATNMTSLANWKEGAIYTLFFNDSNTTLKQSGGSFRLKGSVDVTPSVAKIIQVLASGSLFYEVSRSF